MGAPSTSARTAVVNSPERSATPTPSIATSTVPSGTKPVKLVTSVWRIQRTPSPLIRLRTANTSPSWPGRGSPTDRPTAAAIPDTTTTLSANSANSVTGCGSRLPSHSTAASRRARPRPPRAFFFPERGAPASSGRECGTEPSEGAGGCSSGRGWLPWAGSFGVVESIAGS